MKRLLTRHPFAAGAILGLSGFVLIELVRHSLEPGRGPLDSLWSLWLIPFAALMVGGVVHERRVAAERDRISSDV